MLVAPREWQFGIVDNRSMFASFEGQVSDKSAKFFVSLAAELPGACSDAAHAAGQNT
jgi:hypothetical protein